MFEFYWFNDQWEHIKKLTLIRFQFERPPMKVLVWYATFMADLYNKVGRLRIRYTV